MRVCAIIEGLTWGTHNNLLSFKLLDLYYSVGFSYNLRVDSRYYSTVEWYYYLIMMSVLILHANKVCE